MYKKNLFYLYNIFYKINWIVNKYYFLFKLIILVKNINKYKIYNCFYKLEYVFKPNLFSISI